MHGTRNGPHRGDASARAACGGFDHANSSADAWVHLEDVKGTIQGHDRMSVSRPKLLNRPNQSQLDASGSQVPKNVEPLHACVLPMTSS